MTKAIRICVYLFLSICAASAAASAQESRSTLETFNNAYINTNGVGGITGAILNNFNNQLINSMGAVNDTNYWMGSNTFPPAAIANSLGSTPEGVVNVADYGGCTGSATADTANLNAAFAAARASYSYTNNQPVRLVGGFSATGKACSVTQINATGFTAFGTGSRLIVEDLTLACAGTGNICLDTLGSKNVQFNRVTIVGSSASPPMIGLQEGNPSPASVACCIHTHYGLEITGSFTFAGLYSAASESTTYYSPIIRNNGAALGVIGALGAVSGGSGYANGTYTGVALTGSATGSGALATVVVSGGAVSSVTIANQGKQYAAGDSLTAAASAIGGTGSGFSVPVANIGQFAMVLDGQNHWGVASPFLTASWAADTYYTFTENNIVGGSLRYYGSSYAGVPLWLGSIVGLQTSHTYIAQQATGPCVAMFDNSATGTLHNINEHLGIECETSAATYDVFLTGPNAAPNVSGLHLDDPLSTVSTAILGTDVGISNVESHYMNINVGYTSGQAPLFAVGASNVWHLDGVVNIPFAKEFNISASPFVTGTIDTYLGGAPVNSLGPLDFLNSASGVAGAYSCARRLSFAYAGPLCNIRRVSDSATSDFYAEASGSIDKSAINGFCAGTSCVIVTEYDQSGNGNNATNATTTTQPALTIEGSALSYAVCGTWGEGGNVLLTVSNNSSINNLFNSGGFVSVVQNKTATIVQHDRLISKVNGSNQGWELSGSFSLGSGYPQFTNRATTTNGAWVSSTAMPSTGGHVFDVSYNDASLASVPATAIDGSSLSYQSATQPVGTLADSSDLIIGNWVAGGYGWPGDICEVILARQSLSATQIDAIRRNQAVFYGLAGVE